MLKFEKLAAIDKIANECIQDGDFVLASKFHNEFMKIAQGDARRILRMKIARGFDYEADVSDEELFANIIRISDYIKPERLKNPEMGSNPRNVYTSDMAGATPQNSYSKEYWDNCARSFNKSSVMFRDRLVKNAEALRNAARSKDMNFIYSVFGTR
jgi:hypothetical protein